MPGSKRAGRRGICDHGAGDALANVVGEEFEGAVEAREGAAALDVDRDHDCGVGEPGALHAFARSRSWRLIRRYSRSSATITS